jgi:hypothetical protein
MADQRAKLLEWGCAVAQAPVERIHRTTLVRGERRGLARTGGGPYRRECAKRVSASEPAESMRCPLGGTEAMLFE